MRILLADNDSDARERLMGQLKGLANIEWVGEASTSVDMLDMAARYRPDAVLSEVITPALDGLRCARELARLPDAPSVVFVTRHSDFALEAFDVGACDYLLKPVGKERLAAALAKIKRYRNPYVAGASPQEKASRAAICARLGGQIRLIPLADILYFRAEQKYTTVKTAGFEALIEDSLNALETKLGDDFVRIHRNTLVAMAWLESLESHGHGRASVRLRGLAEPLPVSRRLLPKLRQRMNLKTAVAPAVDMIAL